MNAGGAWDQNAGLRLRAARILAGHNQTECAAALRSAGAPCGSQAAVSEWERGSTRPSAAVREAVTQYVRQYLTASRTAAPEDPLSPAEAFDGIAGRIVGEPLLGPRQAAFVDAMTTRLGSGSPMSDADDRAAATLFVVLGLRDPPT